MGALTAARGFAGAVGAIRGAADRELRRVDEILGPALEGVLEGASDPCPRCWDNLGQAYAAAAQRRAQALAGPWWDRAARAWRRALAEEPDQAELRAKLGGALSRRSRHPAALAVYRAGLRRSPGWSGGRLLTAAALLDMHRPVDAIAEVETVAPALGHRTAWSLLGKAYRSAGRSLDAVEAYRKALRRGPEEPGDLLGLHHASWQAGQGGRVDLLERAVRRGPRQPDGWFALAQARQASGDRAGAERARARYTQLAEALQERLDRQEAATRIDMTAAQALAAIASGRPEGASRILRRAEGSSGLLPLARVALGQPTEPDVEATVRRCVDANP